MKRLVSLLFTVFVVIATISVFEVFTHYWGLVWGVIATLAVYSAGAFMYVFRKCDY